MKQVVPYYLFDPAAGTVTFMEFDVVHLDRLTVIVNSTRNVVLYNLSDPTKGATVSGNVVTLATDTTAMAADDRLSIHYLSRPEDPQYDRLIIGNSRSQFTDNVEASSQPDTAVWDVTNTDHLITHGGNSFGSSYMRISLSPFATDSEATLVSKQIIDFPFRLAFGLSVSQRIVGQEIFCGVAGMYPEPEVIIAAPPPPQLNSTVADVTLTGTTIVVASNVGTVTHTNHGFTGGDRISLYNNPDSRMDIGPVAVTPVDRNTFTVPIVIGNASYSCVGGKIHVADPLRYMSNAFGYLLETATATNASFVARRAGDKFRSANQTISTTIATQGSTAPYSDSFMATSSQELTGTTDEISMRSFATDSLATPAALVKYTQVPDPTVGYKLVIRARYLANATRPIARITSISKSGSTTATVTTDVAHGLVVGNWVQITGVRDQTNFANQAASVVVATVPTTTTFTLVVAVSATTTSQDGMVTKNSGGVLSTAVSMSVASMTRTNGILALVSTVSWGGLLPGEYVHLYGLVPASSALEGAYKVLRLNGTVLELEAPGSDFTIVTTGGAVIKRTDVRLHFARLMDYTRLVTEISGGRGNITDVNNSVPVSLVGTSPVSGSVAVSGSVTALQGTGSGSLVWLAAGWGGYLVADVASAALTTTTTTAAFTPGGNVGVIAHSFVIPVTAVTGTGTPTLDVQVQESTDNGTNWVPIYDFQRITATGSYQSPAIRAAWGTRYRYVQTVAGTSPSFTRSINRIQLTTNAAMVRQFVDRSIVLTTLNSTTPVYYVDGCENLQLTVNLGAASTPPALQLEGSEDGVAFSALGAPLTGVANSSVTLVVVDVLPKFVRARVSTIGVTVTAGFIGIKGIGR